MNGETGTSFGHLLRRYRKAAGLTQEELAERSLLSAFTISALERGANQSPRKDTLALLADALSLMPAERAALKTAARSTPSVPEMAPQSLPPAGHAAGPLVGRAHELALLERHLAGEGPPLLLLAGEPGIGKSRLLQDAARRAERNEQAVLRGDCTRRAAQEPYAPLVQALHGHILGQPTAARQTALRGCAWLVRLLPELTEQGIEPLPSYVLSPEQERRLLFGAVARYLRNVAGSSGILLVLDDLQWAGADALDLSATLLRAAAELSLRVIGAYRTTDVAVSDPLSLALGELAEAALVRQVVLGPLPLAEADSLLGHLLGQSVAGDPRLRERIVTRTGGVPFYLVSCARELAAHAGEESVGDDLPWDVQQSVRRRLAVLHEPVRELLGTAAVIGRIVAYPLLRAVLALADEALLSALEAACQAGLLAPAPDNAYTFAHDVIRELVEADLSVPRRRLLHLRIATALERQSGERAVEALAYHFRQGGDLERAARFAERSGDQAAARFANAQAIGHYRDALTCLDTLGCPLEGARVRIRLGSLLVLTAHYEAALPELEKAVAVFSAIGDLDGLGGATAQIAEIYRLTRRNVECQARLNRVLPAIERRGPSAVLVRLYGALMWSYEYEGRFEESMSTSDTALDVARTIGDPVLLSYCLLQRGMSLRWLTRRREAHAAFIEAALFARAAGDLTLLARSFNGAALTYFLAGDFVRAMDCMEGAAEAHERCGDVSATVVRRANCGWVALFAGDWQRARNELEQAWAVIKGTPSSPARPALLIMLGQLQMVRGELAEAQVLLGDAWEAAGYSGHYEIEIWAGRLLSELELVCGEPERARERLVHLLEVPPGKQEHDTAFMLPLLSWAHIQLGDLALADAAARRGVSWCRDEENWLALVDALRVQAMVQVAQGRWRGARNALEEGIVLARGMPYPYAEGRLLHVYGELHARMGEPVRAWERLEAALAIFRRLGALKDIEQAAQALADLAV